MRHCPLLTLFCLLQGICSLLFTTVGGAAEKPHIVILVADDLGWADVSFHDEQIKTPNLDRLVSEGAELSRYYVCPVCSPTRAGLMTGRYPIRYGLMRAVLPPWRRGGLDLAEVTMPEVLARAGYKHRGIFGKWHLGHSDIQYHPLRRGFTEFVGHYNGAIDYFTHQRDGMLDWHRDHESNRDEGYSTDLIAAAVLRPLQCAAQSAASEGRGSGALSPSCRRGTQVFSAGGESSQRQRFVQCSRPRD